MSNLATVSANMTPGSSAIELAVTGSKSTIRDRHKIDTESSAKQLLESHPHFRGRSQWIHCCCLNDCLYLKGTLPSFYLKQSAQEALRELAGIKRIVNLIQVASPGGFVVRPPMAAILRKPR